MRSARKTNTKQKYIMMVTSEDERYNPNYPNGGGVQLGFFADHPWEGRFECFIAGDDHKELMEEIARCGCEGLFYQLYENENGNRIGYGVVDCDAIEDDINEYETEKDDTEILTYNIQFKGKTILRAYDLGYAGMCKYCFQEQILNGVFDEKWNIKPEERKSIADEIIIVPVN